MDYSRVASFLFSKCRPDIDTKNVCHSSLREGETQSECRAYVHLTRSHVARGLEAGDNNKNRDRIAYELRSDVIRSNGARRGFRTELIAEFRLRLSLCIATSIM